MTSRKQAIAIGPSEARKRGAKVPREKCCWVQARGRRLRENAIINSSSVHFTAIPETVYYVSSLARWDRPLPSLSWQRSGVTYGELKAVRIV